MEREVLSALLDLRIAIGELQAALIDIDKTARKLMAVQLDALASKNTPTLLSSLEKPESSTTSKSSG